ncbi:hypothetical protein HK097_006455 [Rhizophlyctis rosea]|uniref:Pectate lyase n=1 Tax=Rhizophlyctis rosea TaxID=64517 RepID=A0AAD5SKM9_9FUNG|nr:hypothetical protein HK097_006455 [Rhizophlyctis rosea]
MAAPFAASAQTLLAFPGAEGFGAYAKGGRGGSVYVVTNLNNSGTGSLRDAMSKSDRIIVFAVGGQVKITERLVGLPRQTILGQTAPGGGITVYGNGISFSNANDSIVRYIRFRMGVGGTSGKDAIAIAEGKNMIFDHVSVSWGKDETFSISGDVSNVTIMNTIISGGLEPHSCGGLMQTDGGVSILRSLYVDNNTRNPKVKGVNDFVNNVVYNWGRGGGYILGGESEGISEVNIVGNYYIAGPNSTADAFSRGNTNFKAYFTNNIVDTNRNGKLDGTTFNANSLGIEVRAARYNYPAVKSLLTAQQAYDYVLANVGASLVRDSIDTYYINNVRSLGTKGNSLRRETDAPLNGPGSIASVTGPKDTDGDGIPDAWEVQNGLDPNVKDSTKLRADGYTYIEAYANSLVGGGNSANTTTKAPVITTTTNKPVTTTTKPATTSTKPPVTTTTMRTVTTTVGGSDCAAKWGQCGKISCPTLFVLMLRLMFVCAFQEVAAGPVPSAVSLVPHAQSQTNGIRNVCE